MVPKDSSGFAISLQRGSDPECAELHVQLRAQLAGSPALVWNTRSGGTWGVEEQLPGPFPLPLWPRPFLLSITAYLDAYEVEVAGSANFSLPVRDGLPVSAVTHLAVSPQLSLRAIHAAVESMPRQLRLSLGSGLKTGDAVFVRGQPTQDAKSFAIKCQNGPGKLDDVLYQLDSRLDEDRVAANSRLDEAMGVEEVIAGECPFRPDTPFLLAVGVATLGFETRLDRKEWHDFRHRQEVSNARTLLLEGDLQPTDIAIDCAQPNPSNILDTKDIKSRGVRLHLFCPELPVSSRVTGGFEKGCLLLISAKLNSHPTRFQVSLQCGDGADDDVALSCQVAFQEGGAEVLLNSRADGEWGQSSGKKQVELHPGCCFDLLLLRTAAEGDFRCLLDGVEVAALGFRMDGEDARPDHVAVEGDAQVRRVMAL